MSTTSWERYAPLTGVLFVLFTVAGILVGLSDSPEDFPAPVDEIVEYYEDDPGKVMFGSWLGLIGGFFLIWFASSVRSRLRDGGQVRLASVAFGGAVAAAAIGMLIDTANMAAAIRADEDEAIDPATATALYDFATTAIGGGLAAALAVFVAATGVAALRTAALPSWLAMASLVIAVALLIPPIAWAVTAVALLWALIVSVLLFRSQSAAPAAGGPPSG
jgi:hypothetical protein